MSEWQPIETAPKDFSRVLVWDGMCVWIAHQGAGMSWSSEGTEYTGFYLKSAKCAGLTHWMPLPEAPK